MTITIQDAKKRLDEILNKSRVDLYKPIQIAEVLYKARKNPKLNLIELNQYQNPSIKWRNEITNRFTGKVSTSSARYQHDLWNKTAMPPEYLNVLHQENKRLNGAVEKYIYEFYFKKIERINVLISYIENTNKNSFSLKIFLNLFICDPGLRRSIDKAYEIVTYSLFETLVNALEAKVSLDVPIKNKYLIEEFPDLAKILLGVSTSKLSYELPAHVYRVGVTNAADRGLDMWANFGIAIQVKHLTLNDQLAVQIVDQIESDNIVIVCTDADARTIQIIARQIGWGKRVRGIVKQSELEIWYEKCLKGRYAPELGDKLLKELKQNFYKEFPQARTSVKQQFYRERGYDSKPESKIWIN